MKNIVVIFGGNSCESDVSIITGVMTANALDKNLFFAVPVYVDKDGCFYTGNELFDLDNFKVIKELDLKRVEFSVGDNTLYYRKKNKLKQFIKVDAIINCCHGGVGEKGSLYGYFETIGIPMASPGLLASSVAIDKVNTKRYLKGNGVNTAKWLSIKNGESVGQVALVAEEQLGYPMIIKPNTLGSSIGIKVVCNLKEFTVAVMQAFKYDDVVIIEEFISDATEINCAVYKTGIETVVSECERPMTTNSILTFEDKYCGGEREFPAKIPKALSDKIKGITKRVYEMLDARGIMRFDFLLSKDKIYLNEMNSVPGSLAYYLLSNTFKEFRSVLTEIITSTIIEYNSKATLERNFSSNILSGKFNKGGKNPI